MLVRNIHLGIVYRVYDGITINALGKMEWMSNSYGMYVTSSIALGKMEWMSNSYLQCQQGETLNVRLNSFVERRYV